MTEEAKKARAEYMAAYRKNHKESINATTRAWRAKNQDKTREYRARYWERKAAQQEQLNG